MIDLNGKVAVVTGAGSGIGAETARHLATLGAQVVVSDIDADRAVAVADGIGDAARAIAADMADEAAIASLFDGTITAFGRLDILHANAALTDPAVMSGDLGVATMDVDTWDRTMVVNLRGPMLCVKHGVPHMVKGGGGSIVFTASGRALQGDFSQTAYGASKAGLLNLCRYVAAQHGKAGIRANALVVGLILTDGLRANLPPPVQALLLEHHLTPFLGEPSDVAATVAWLASDAARFITGSEIAVDGGFTSHAPQYADMARMMSAPALQQN